MRELHPAIVAEIVAETLDEQRQEREHARQRLAAWGESQEHIEAIMRVAERLQYEQVTRLLLHLRPAINEIPS